MTPDTTDARPAILQRLWRRSRLVLVPATVSVLTTLLVVRFVPVSYQSQATMMVVPAQVPAEYVHEISPVHLDSRLAEIKTSLFSRTRLERLINEYKLYPNDVGRRPIEEILERMASNVQVEATSAAASTGAVTVTVRFRADDPRTAQRVAAALAAYVVADSEMNQANLTQATAKFLDAMIEDARTRLDDYARAHPAAKGELRSQAIEREVLEDTYRSLLTKRQDARIAVDLERRQIGERITVLDSARIPERPVGFTRTQLYGAGALAGLLIGGAVVGVSSKRLRS